MRPARAIYTPYAALLQRRLQKDAIPEHVGVILDGNRRWASLRDSTTEHGHRAGAAKIADFLSWCDDVGVKVVTLWLLSTDNLDRQASELSALLEIIANAVSDLAERQAWRIHPVGALDLLPDDYADRLRAADERTARITGLTVNVAVGYGGRREVVDAVRALLQDRLDAGVPVEDIAAEVDVESIGAHLYTKGQPDPELVIRTSGEQRLSGFLLWQSAHSEFYFCEAFWPDFRKIDFLRALRSYSQRQRRFGE